MNSIPLVRNNSVNDINTSLIALRKVLRELTETTSDVNKEIEKYVLKSDVVNVVESGNDNPVTSGAVYDKVTDTINSLDVSSVGGSGKYISAISETDGKINATASDIDTAVTSGSNNPVTSGGVANALNIPTDAVLHYSFDEVPDYPDGTAVYKHIKDFTSTSDWSVNSSRTVLSLDNNGLKAQSTGTDGYVQLWGTQTNVSNISNKIVKIKWHSNANCTLYLRDLTSPYTRHSISQKSLGNNVYEAIGYTESFSINQSLFFLFYSVSADNYVVIDEIYIGDGSYTTPIIDNANGQFNATNNGGIATKGVSGKGASFLEGEYAIVNNFSFFNNFSISVWIYPENNTSGKEGFIFSKPEVFGIKNGSASNNHVYIYGYYVSNNSEFRFDSDNLLDVGWNHIVVVKNGVNILFYKNGIKISTYTLTSSEIKKSSTFDTYVSRNNNTRPQSIDDLLIFDRALTENEVIALYLNKGNTPKYYSWADWKLNQIENAQTRTVETKGGDEEKPIEEER